MTEDKSSDFKFRIDEESPDSVFQDEIRELRLEKLSKRVTIVSILIPCLIGGLIAIAYLDLKKRVFINQDTGAKTVQGLSKDMDAKLYEQHGTKENPLQGKLIYSGPVELYWDHKSFLGKNKGILPKEKLGLDSKTGGRYGILNVVLHASQGDFENSVSDVLLEW